MSRALALQFIAGKYEGGALLLPEQQEMFIGRSSTLEIPLLEDMVSRRHASLTTGDDQPLLRDLQSTNGTYVNGERIEERHLRLQDRVLIGTSILRLTLAEDVDAWLAKPSTLPAESPDQPLEGTPILRGALGDVPVAELVRLLSNNRKTGLLLLTDAHAPSFELVFVDGQLTHASLSSLPTLPAPQALSTAIGRTTGHYAFEQPAEGFERPTSFESPNDALLAQAVAEHAAVASLHAAGWGLAARVSLAAPQPMSWSSAQFTPAVLDTLQLALTFAQVQEILANAPLGAKTTLESLDWLTQRQFLLRSC